MRYIADSSGYVKEVSFGAAITCGGSSCREYTGIVPSGYSSLMDWFTKEGEYLYRWRVVSGNLTLVSDAKAPATEWLGTFETETDLNNALAHRFGCMTNDTSAPTKFVLNTIGDWTWYGTLFRSSATYAVVDVVSGYGGHVSRITKTLTAGTWTALEWDNPPMVLGVEYRTTERFNGKAVYAKLFDVGELPTNSHKKVAHGLTKTAVVSLYGASTNGKYYFPSSYTGAASDHSVDLYINSTDIIISTVSSWEGVYGYVVVKYTKA